MIAEHIKRFILTSIDSIPHLEAILLLRCHQQTQWDLHMIAQTLYISEKRAKEILKDLCASHFITEINQHLYRYEPASFELKQSIDQTADVYATNLIEVTNLIHSKADKQAQKFGDAFKW